MGTSSSKAPIPQDNDFYQEAYNYTTHNTEGIVVTDANNKEQNVQYYKTLNPPLHFLICYSIAQPTLSSIIPRLFIFN